MEIGGGTSIILDVLQHYYECYNIDKLEGCGNGPLKSSETFKYKLIRDYMGNFNESLPDNYFDCVFSISVMEHLPAEPKVTTNVYADINRVLKHGASSFHTIDVIISPHSHYWNFITMIDQMEETLITPKISLDELRAKPDLWSMSKEAYDRNWKPITKAQYEEHIPTNILMVWKKHN